MDVFTSLTCLNRKWDGKAFGLRNGNNMIMIKMKKLSLVPSKTDSVVPANVTV